MYPKCSLNSYSSYLQIFGLLSLVIILIIVGFYYMRVNHYNILEKYGDLNLDYKEYKDISTAQSGDRSTYPLNKYPGADLGKENDMKNKYELRECKVYFTDKIADCDAIPDTNNNKACSYTFNGWQEFDKYTDKDGQIIEYPKKIFSKNLSNTNDLVNSYFTSKCFKEFDNKGLGKAQPFEYSENDLIKYDSKGKQDNTEIDTNRFGGKKYTSIQFLSSTDASNNFNALINSICSVKYTNTQAALVGKKFYKFILNNYNVITQIQKVQLNQEQTEFISIQDDAIKDFAFEGKCGIRINGNKLQVFVKSEDIYKNVKIYKFTYIIILCAQSKIKNFTTYDRNININKFVDFTNCSNPIANGAIFDNIDLEINLDALTDAEKNSFRAENIDYTQDILSLISRKVTERITILKEENDIAINNATSLVNFFEEKRNTVYYNIDKYIPKEDKTFLGVIKLKKELSTTGIFDYSPGYMNTILDEINIPSNSVLGPDHSMLMFTNTENTAQKEYTFTVPEGTEYRCQILVVGGGGGGGSRHAGGGGGGAVINMTNQTLRSGTYIIKVGSGGRGAQNMGQGEKGADSSIFYNNNPIILAKGGGGGNHFDNTPSTNKDGGSGGGGGPQVNIGNAIDTNIPSGKYGNSGGKGSSGNDPLEWEWGGGGGGGAGGAGKNSEKGDDLISSSEGVTVYTGRNYTGIAAIRTETPGEYDMYYTGQSSMGIPNDTLNSIKIPYGYMVRLYFHGSFGAPTLDLLQDTPSLDNYMDPNWQNNTSGYKVFKISSSYASAGNGGDGTSVLMGYSSEFLVGGGGGGGCFINSKSAGKGGIGGGGAGSMGSSKAENGYPHTGGGGGGGGFNRNNINGIGGDGGSGLVVINILKSLSFQRKMENLKMNDLYNVIPDDTNANQLINISRTKLQYNIITSFVFLQKGYYRFRADIGDESINDRYGHPNIKNAYLGIYDESVIDEEGNYNFLLVFKYNNENKPAYLKSYLNIKENKFYKLVYFYIAYDISGLRFNLWCTYSSNEPTLELTYTIRNITRDRTITEVKRIPISVTIKESNKITSDYMYEDKRIVDIKDVMNQYLFWGTKETSLDMNQNNSVYQHYNLVTFRDIFSTITYKNDEVDSWKNFQTLAYYLKSPSINFFNITKYDDDLKTANDNLTIERNNLVNKINSDIIIQNLQTLRENIKKINYVSIIGNPDACLKPSVNITAINFNINNIDDRTFDRININRLGVNDNLLTPNLVPSIYIEA